MKRTALLMVLFAVLAISQIWAEGGAEANKIHPGAKLTMETGGYRFDSEGNLVALRDMRIKGFPNEYQSNTNPYAYEKNTIYLTNFDIRQWIDKSALATTGNDLVRTRSRTLLGSDMNRILDFGAGGSLNNGTRIYIRNIPDQFLRQMINPIQNALLVYIGAQTFQMADGTSQVFPVFELLDFYGDIVSSALSAFNAAFDRGIYEEKDGYQYSRVNNRVFGRDVATKRELYEWNGEQWIQLAGNQ